MYFPTRLYNIRVLESCQDQGRRLVTDKNLIPQRCDMNWGHCRVMARYVSRPRLHNYVPDNAASVPDGKAIIGHLADDQDWVRVKGPHRFPSDMQDEACKVWTDKMQGWIQRGFTLPPPSGPLPYHPGKALADSLLNRADVVKPSAEGQPELDNMAAQPVGPVQPRRSRLTKFRTSEPQIPAADDTSEAAASLTAPSVSTETSWSI